MAPTCNSYYFKFGSAYRAKVTREALPIPIIVGSIFVYPNNGVAAIDRFSTCTGPSCWMMFWRVPLTGILFRPFVEFHPRFVAGMRYQSLTVPIWRRGPTSDCLLYVRGGVSNLLLVGYQWHIVYNGGGVGISDIMFVVEGRVSMTYCLYQRSWGGCQWYNVCSRGTLSVIYSLCLGVGY